MIVLGVNAETQRRGGGTGFQDSVAGRETEKYPVSDMKLLAKEY
jgi:hypothetical protein